MKARKSMMFIGLVERRDGVRRMVMMLLMMMVMMMRVLST